MALKRWSIFWLCAGIFAAVLNLFCVPGPLKSICGLLLLLFLPGWALTAVLVRKYPLEVLERWCVSVGASLAVTIVCPMIVHLLGLSINATILVLVLGTISTLPHAAGIFFSAGAGIEADRPQQAGWERLALAGILVVTVFFRFAGLGYSEYQGDEDCVAKSVKVVTGDASILTEHRRPSAHIILPAAVYLTCRSYSEWLTRAPLAVAGTCVVLLIYLLGRKMFGAAAGLTAGLFAALSGFGVAFSRIVQYQMVVVLFACLTAFYLWKLMHEEQRERARFHLLLAASAFGMAGVAHYEGLLLFPAVLFALGYKYRLRGLRENWRILAAAAGVFLGIVLLFYLPLYFSRQAATNAAHYSKRWGRGLYFHWDFLWVSGCLYSSAAAMVALMVLSPPAVFTRKWRELVFTFLWFIAYFIVFMSLMKKPGTHVQNAFYPWYLLAGAGFGAALKWSGRLAERNRAAGRICAAGLVCSLLAAAMLTAWHVHAVLVSHSPELVWSGPWVKSYGRYGFPCRRGWKTLGYLFRTGELSGTYKSNEKRPITDFYLRQSQSPSRERTKYVLHLPRPQSKLSDKFRSPGRGYVKIAVITSPAGALLITVYELGASDNAQVRTYVAGQLSAKYLALDGEAPDRVKPAVAGPKKTGS